MILIQGAALTGKEVGAVAISSVLERHASTSAIEPGCSVLSETTRVGSNKRCDATN